MVDRESPVPIYYQLKLHFKRQMESGVLRPGDRLPTEMELCEQYNISRAPVRQALTELAREGYLYRRSGQGTFVARLASLRLEQQTDLHVLIHYDARWLGSMENTIHTWNQLHPEQEVNLRAKMCARDDFHQTLRKMVAQGEAPDMVPLDYVWIMDYARAGYIVPLDTLDASWVHEQREALEPPVLKNNTVDGCLCGVPVQADVTGLWYRRDWFADEGVQPPETWDAWLELMDYFAKPDTQQRLGNRYAVAFPVGTASAEATINLLIPFIWLAGAALDEETEILNLDTPAVYQAVHFLREITLKRRAYLPPEVVNLHWWDFAALLARGVVPMLLGGTYEWPRIRDESDWTEEEDAVAHLGFVPIPRPSVDVPQVGSLGGTSWAILQQSPARELCMEILKLACAPETLRSFCEEHLQISPNRAVNEQLCTADHPWLSTIIPLLRLGRPRPLLSNYLQVSRFVQDMLEQVLWEGAPPEETIRRTAQSLALLSGT